MEIELSNKCPYCHNTGRRKIGKFTKDKRQQQVKCEVCNSHDRKVFYRELRKAAKENHNDRENQ